MGDGQRREYGLVLCTDSFTLEEVVRLVNVLILRYNLKCTLHVNKKNYNRIYISRKSLSDLIIIIKPYIVPSMYYKLSIINNN